MLNYNMELKLELCMIIHISGKNRDYTYYIQVLLLCRDYRNVVIRGILIIWLLCSVWSREFVYRLIELCG